MDTTESDGSPVEATPPAIQPVPQTGLQGFATSIVGLVRNALGYKEAPPPESPKQVDPSKGKFSAFAKWAQAPEINDRDRDLVFFAGLKTMSTLPAKSPMRTKFNGTFLNLVSDDRGLSRRSTELTPNGRQSSRSKPYSRAVRECNPMRNLPDISRVFDELLKARSFFPHENSLSGLVPAFATIVSLCLYRTDPNDPNCNQTSQYIDLSPLYGSNDEEHDFVRQKDGRGMLSPDCFFEDRLMLLTPAVQALLILWNRHHNFIAERLLQNHDDDRWKDPAEIKSEEALKRQDDEIFEAARSINCGVFKTVVMEDFFKGIAGLSNVGNGLDLDPLTDSHESKTLEHKSYIEFSLLYHWSSLSSKTDVEWTERATTRIFGGRSMSDVTIADYDNALRNYERESDQDRRRRESAGLARGENGYFDDNDLARVLQNASHSVAGAPGARSVPQCMRMIGLVAMQQARSWNVCSFNQFRRSLGLKALTSFDEWNSDPEILSAVRQLYGNNIENLELYPGLIGEKSSPGEGFGLGYTATFALLVDLVSSIRADPRSSKTPDQLTQWGYDECFSKSKLEGAFGAVLPKVLSRNLSYNYPYDNTYTLFPFTAQDKRLSPNLFGAGEGYNRARPGYTKVLQTNEAIRHVLNHPEKYATCYGQNFKTISDGYGFLLGFDTEKLHHADQRMNLHALLPDLAALTRYMKYIAKTANDCIEESAKDPKKQIDVVNDVIAATCARWICDTMCGVRNPKNPDHMEVYRMLQELYAFVFDLNDTDQAWDARKRAKKTSEALLGRISEELEKALSASEETIKERLKRIYDEATGRFEVGNLSPLPFLTRMAMKHAATLREYRNWTSIRNEAEIKDLALLHDPCWTEKPTRLVEQINRDRQVEKLEKEFRKKRIAANVLGLCIMSVQLVQVCAEAVDFYLRSKDKTYIRGIVDMAERDSPNDNPKIMGYIREAQRLRQPPAIFRVVRGAPPEGYIIQQGGRYRDLVVHDGDVLNLNFCVAFMNPKDTSIDPKREPPIGIQGLGFHKCPGIKLVDEVLPELFKAIFRLQNLCISSDGHLTAGRTAIKTPGRHICKPPALPPPLRVTFTGVSKPQIRWKEPKNILDNSKRWQVVVKRIKRGLMAFVAFVVFLLFIMLLFRGFRLPSIHLPSLHVPSFFKSTPKDAVCRQPLTVFDPWHSEAIVPARDGKPLPVQYTYKSRRPHRLSVVDIDKRDTRLELFVDGQTRGVTTDFELDKTVNCGTDLRTCLAQHFSAGVIDVPPGKHTVKMVWAGKDFINGTTDIDWGDERIRRFQMQREDCS